MSWFLFSTEGKRVGLPAKCEVLARMKLPDGREAALVKCERTIPAYDRDEFLLVPRGKDEMLFGPHQAGEIVTVHIVDSSEIGSSGELRLGSKTPIDWGAIAFEESTAKEWAN